VARADVDDVFVRRTRLLYWSAVAVLVLYVGRLYFLQVVAGDRYRDHAQANSVKEVPIDPPRGFILDRRGRVLVGNREAHDLVVDRERVKDWAGLAAWISAVTAEDPRHLEARLRKKDHAFAYRPMAVARDLAFSQVAWVEARREAQPAVRVETTMERQYAHAEAAHLLGYVAEIGAEELARPEIAAYHRQRDLIGKGGVEKQFDRLLSGQRGVRRVTVDSLGREIGSEVAQPATRGADVHLTLDLDVQAAAERALAGQRGACVVLDVRDGAVLALASAPAYDPNAFVGGISKVRWNEYRKDPADPLRFRALAGTYPPGSAFKPLVSAAALETRTHGPEFSVSCRGVIKLYDRDRRCWKEEGHGTVDMHEAMQNSCNVYYYLTARDVGVGPLQRLGEAMGFGQSTGIDLPGERVGVMPSDAWKRANTRNHERWYPGDTINLGIGQGFMSVTPLQVACYAMAIANGGAIRRPHVFRRAVDDQTGRTVQAAQVDLEFRTVPLSPATVRFLHRSMADVVERGTGRRAAVPGVRVAGKTGTAQPSSGDAPPGVPREERELRYQEHAWFMGFAPVEAPEIAVAVVIEHAGFHGGEVAAPVAREVIAAYFLGQAQVAGQ
jgi:penicillin-binding protein 2